MLTSIIISILLGAAFILYTKYVYEWGYCSGALDEIKRTENDIQEITNSIMNERR